MVVQILDNNIQCNIWGQLLRVEFNLFWKLAYVGATKVWNVPSIYAGY